MDNHDEAYLDGLDHPVELTNLETHASGAITLNAEWIAYLDQVHLPDHIAGIDHGIRHDEQGGGTAYA